MNYEEFWNMSKRKQADFIWKTVFIDNIPMSESARSVLTIFKAEGMDVNCKDLNYYRKHFDTLDKSEYVDRIFDIVGLDYIVMTNDPFDKVEAGVWADSYVKDDRFKTALRLDVLLNTPEVAFSALNDWGYAVMVDADGKLSKTSIKYIKRFLADQIDMMEALYCAASLPPCFLMDDGSIRAQIMETCVLPVCREKNIPVALMIGVIREVNNKLRHAGSSLGKADIKMLHYLCSNFPQNKFLVTMLARENQHELTACGRIFNNLLIFGCWWFLNNPSLEKSLTEMRIEMLGNAFVAQHSDACIFGQLISKWDHYKPIISQILYEKYGDLIDSGYYLTNERINKDVYNLFGGNFWLFLGK